MKAQCGILPGNEAGEFVLGLLPSYHVKHSLTPGPGEVGIGYVFLPS
jgi:hypothetical protein